MTKIRLIRMPEVMNITGLARSTIYKFIADGEFPKQVPLGANSAAWVLSEVEAWVLDKVAERDEENAE